MAPADVQRSRGVASAAMFLAALNRPGLHPGYNTSRPRPPLDPALHSAFREAHSPRLRVLKPQNILNVKAGRAVS